MVGSSKILTVSYGTFSCTLEGFEDSFSTMKAIAEYFRDLAADDRYFGAEPATPDADMLARIAEREIARRVEARTEGTGIVLRAGTALPVSHDDHGDAGTSEAAPRKEDAATPEASDDLTDLPDRVADTAVTDAPAAALDEVAEPVAERPVTAVVDAPAMPPALDRPAMAPSAAPAAPATGLRSPASERIAPTGAETRRADTTPTPRVTERPSMPAHPDAESVAAKLQRIRAVVGRAAPLATGAAPALAGGDTGADDTDADTETPRSSASGTAGASAVTDSAPVEAKASKDDGVVRDAVSAAITATAHSAAAGTTSVEAPVSLTKQPTPNRIEARVIKMRRADFEAAVGTGTLVEDPDDQGPADTTLSAEDEAALLAELAALEGDDEADGRPVAFDDPDDAEESDVVTADLGAAEQVAPDDAAGDDDDTEDDADIADRDEDIAEDNARSTAEASKKAENAEAAKDADENIPSDDADGTVTAAVAEPDATAPKDATGEEANTAAVDPTGPTLASSVRSALAASLAGADAEDLAATTDNLFAGGDDDTDFDASADDDTNAFGDNDLDDDDDVADGEVDEIDPDGDYLLLVSDDIEKVAKASDAPDGTGADDDSEADPAALAARASEAPEADDSDETDDAAGPLRPRRVRLPVDPVEDEADLARIAEQTDAEMDSPENRSRRDAIHQLKAAVAATEAARKLGEMPEPDEDDDHHETAFRDDLQQVVRPRRPVRDDAPEGRTERPRPAPLKLVASLRVDAPVPAPRTVSPVRPRRVSVSDLTSAASPDTPSFADFAAEMGARGLNDLMEAAAAHTAFVEGHEDFSRPQLMSKIQDASSEPLSREDGLRAFGSLLRQGRLVKVRNGRFAVSGDTRFNPERRAG